MRGSWQERQAVQGRLFRCRKLTVTQSLLTWTMNWQVQVTRVRESTVYIPRSAGDTTEKWVWWHRLTQTQTGGKVLQVPQIFLYFCAIFSCSLLACKLPISLVTFESSADVVVKKSLLFCSCWLYFFFFLFISWLALVEFFSGKKKT